MKENQAIKSWFKKYLSNLSEKERINYLKEICTYGCSSGCITSLKYSSNIISFYHRYETEIWEIISTYLKTKGQTFGQFWDSFKVEIVEEHLFKVYLTYFAIEQIASELLTEFERN